MLIPSEIQKRIDSWSKPPFERKVQQEIQDLLEKNPKELLSAFADDLSFGTGGMRAIMGIGSCRMNIYTVRLATQALANYLKKVKKKDLKIFIGYDVRHHSKEFAQEAALILAGNEIDVYITETICPTPLTSFGCRFFHCDAAIMITASHNPPEYNGYKVYWNDGAQLVFPHDIGVIEEVKKTKDWTLGKPNSPRIIWVDQKLDQAYYQKLEKERLYPIEKKEDLKILYTNLHGTGIRLMENALKIFGFSNLSKVEEQTSLDPNFSYAKSPNPEEFKALSLGLEKMEKESFDLLLATDPDADRVGVAVLHHKKAVRLTGNQVAALLLDMLVKSQKRSESDLPSPHKSPQAVVKSIVTTSLLEKIAKAHDLSCFNVLTGFKYIAEKIRNWEEDRSFHFLFGAEESCGYLYESFVRDKDGIQAACLIAEAAFFAKQEGKTLVDQLYSLYEQYGIHRDLQRSLSFEETIEGHEKVRKIMGFFRKNPPDSLNGNKIERMKDYLQTTDLPKTDMIELKLSNQTKWILRPSGTEPKLKIYAEAMAPNKKPLLEEIEKVDQELNNTMEALLALLSSDI